MAAPVQSRPYRCWVEIDLAALERNIGLIRANLPRYVRYVAVVKADAYGHGVPEVASRLMQCGVDAFAVANVAEAAQLREIGAGWPILVLGATLPEEEEELLREGLTATVSSLDELASLQARAQQLGRPAKVHIKVDTGMGRLGFWHEAACAGLREAARCPDLRLEGAYTHFSSADTDPAFTALQRERFLAVRQEALPHLPERPLLWHADNSAGLDTFDREGPFNAVRVGLLQFGLSPHRHSLLARLPVEPVLSFHTRVALVKRLPAGTPISYGQTHRLPHEAQVAVLTAGYGDGLPVVASNRAEVLLRGQRCPVLGRITMDQTMVDVSALPGLERGETATLIGQQGAERLSVQDWSSWADSIPWELFCSITKRVTRLYQTHRTS